MSGQPVTSRKAAAGLGLAVLLFAVGVFGPVPVLVAGGLGLALAVLALRDIRRRGELRGRALAWWGITANGVGLLAFLILLPGVRSVRESARQLDAV